MRIVGVTLILVVSLLASNAISPADALKYSVCEEAKSIAQIKNVSVSECETLINEPCPFNRGLNKSIEIEFVPNQDVEQVNIKVAGKLSAMIPFFVQPELACGNYGFECPLKAGTPYKFKLTLPILRAYPKLKVDVFVRLIDKKGQLLGCVEIPAKIQEPNRPEA